MTAIASIVGILVLAIVVAYVSKILDGTTYACTNDAAVNFSDEYSIDPCHAFSDTYQEARSKFRKAALGSGAELHSLPLKSKPEDRDLTIDIAVLYGGGTGLAVHTSGVHGVEGYAGSAIQVAFLESISTKWRSNAPHNERPTIVFVHAFNPYGMDTYRRPNENNVDLNRNALHPDEWKDTPFEPIGPYKSYADFDETLFNPRRPPTALDAYAGILFKGVIALIRHGHDKLKEAMVTAQYFYPKGIFYGGNELQSSHRIVWDFFNDQIFVPSGSVNHDNSSVTTCCTGTVTWIDVHTGLGKSGVDTLIGHDETSSSQAEMWFPNSGLSKTSKDSQEVVKGYHAAKGFTYSLFRRLFSESQQKDSLILVQEFGTVPTILVARALILENMAYHFLPDEDPMKLEWAKRTTKRAFYKQTSPWRKSVLLRGLDVLLQSIKRSTSTIKNDQ